MKIDFSGINNPSLSEEGMKHGISDKSVGSTKHLSPSLSGISLSLNNSHTVKNEGTASSLYDRKGLFSGDDREEAKQGGALLQGIDMLDASVRHNYYAIMSNSMSDEDYKELQKEGFHPGTMDADEMVTCVDQIKAKLAQSGTVIAGYNDDLSSSDIEAAAGDSAAVSADSIERALRENDLPVTSSNEEQLREVLDLAAGLSDVNRDGLSQQSIIYMINNELEPTLYNVYQARMSTGSYVPGGRSVDDGQLTQLVDQIDNVITESGYEVDPETKADAVILLKNGIPLTSDRFNMYEGLKALSIPDGDALLHMGAQAMTEGKKAAELSLIRQERQLYETQLQMTNEANRLLLKSDFYIDTESIMSRVDSLKELEESLMAKYSGQSFDNAKVLLGEAEQAPALYMQTMVRAAVMEYVPIDTVADLAESDLTFDDLYQKGMQRAGAYERAQETYEAVGTQVRRDLGDSIKKAFGNVDDILSDLGQELNESNRRAVRILGYNNTEITGENISRMRQADEKVQGVLQSLTPGAVLRLIRAGENPLNMSIDSLRSRLDEYNDESGSLNESYARFLVKLEHNNSITEQEKESFIGIYRLFRQVEKSDGAVIGSLINQGAELSVKNLVTSVRNRRMQGGMEYNVDDDFGSIERVIPEGIRKIDAQISTAFSSPEYYRHKNRQILEDLEPGQIKDALKSGELTMETSLEGMWEISREAATAKEDLDAQRAALKEESEFVRRAMDTDEGVLKALEASGIEANPMALSAMKELLYNRGDVFKRLADMGRQLNIAEMIEDFETEDGAKKAIEDLTDDAGKDIEAAMESADMTSMKLRSLMLMEEQISVIREMSRSEHYEVPMEIDGEMTSVSLKVIKGTGQSSVEISTQTEEYGAIKVTFEPDGDDINGYMIAHNRWGEAFLQEKKAQLKEAFAAVGESLSENFGIMRNPGLSLTGAETGTAGNTGIRKEAKAETSQSGRSQAEDETPGENRISSQRLYRIAKVFLQVI